MMEESLHLLHSISLRALVKANWGRSSDFLTGINYTGDSGDIWTSLALKKEVTQRELSLPQARAAIDQDLFNLIPSWIKNLVQYEDIDLKGTANERPVKDLVDFVFVGPSISKNEFCLIFAYACLRNASIFFFEKDYFPLSHHSVKRFSFSSGDFLVIPRNDFNRWLDELHEVKG